MRDTNTFAWRLRQHRDAMGITQFEMCDRIVAIIRRDVDAGFSMTYPAYNKLETGDTATPRHPVLKAIKEITGLSLDYLIVGEEPEGAANYSTPEAEQVATIVDTLPESLRQVMLNGAQILRQMDRRLEQAETEQVLFLQKIKALLPEQERLQAISILEKLSRVRNAYR